MLRVSRRLWCFASALVLWVSAGGARAEDNSRPFREVPNPSPKRLSPRGAATVLIHAGLSLPEAGDPDPRIGTYVSSIRGFYTNSYWIEGPEGLVLIGTQYLTSAAEEFVNWAEQTTGKKAVLAVVLEPNPDSFNGVAVMKKRGIKVVTSEQIRGLIPQAHQHRLETFHERGREDFPQESEALLPESLGEKDTEVSAGGVKVKVLVLGQGSSEAHLVVAFEGSAFVGNLVSNNIHPWLEQGQTDEWLSRLKELRVMRPDFIYPAHGSSGDGGLLVRQAEYLRTFVEEVTAEKKRAGARPHPRAFERVRARVLERYPGYPFPIFVDTAIQVLWDKIQIPGQKPAK